MKSIKQKEKISKEDFYRSKYEYYGRYCHMVVIVAAICSIFYFVSDCQLCGRFAIQTFIPRFIILIPLMGYLFLSKREVSYKVIILMSYIILHLIMWNTIWAIRYLPDKTHASEGFIIMQVMFLAIGFFSPAFFSTIMHALVIGNILLSNTFNHYANLDIMLSLGIPCAVGICTVYFVMEHLYLNHYQTNQKLEEYSLYDSLTSVYNRNIMPSLLEEDKIHFKYEFGIKVAVMMLDIDFFKRVNDIYGHGKGDEVLKWICARVKELTKEGYVVRWGGEEFLVILPGMNLSQATERAEQMRSEVELHSGEICPLTISIGVDIYNTDDVQKADYKKVIDNADRALYMAKRNGRNRVEIFDKHKIDPIYLASDDTYDESSTSLDKTGLDNRVFEAFAATSKTQYIYLCNMKTNVSRWSQYAVDYFGLPDAYIFNTGAVWAEYIHPDDRERYFQDIGAVFSGEKSIHDIEYRAKNAEGNYVLCTCRGVVLKGEHGEPDYFAGTMVNHGIIDRVDPVTNLYNTYELLNIISQKLQRREKFGILLVGIMHFGDVNDAHGYAASDVILQQFANQLKMNFSNDALLFREDGVKFALLFKDFEQNKINVWYEKIQEIAFQEISVNGVHIPLSIAGGSIHVDSFGGSEYTVRAGASYALQISKNESFGKLIYFDRNQKDESMGNLEMMNEIVSCVSDNCERFSMVYQPIIHTRTGKVAGAEALLRWSSRNQEIISPNRFINWLENEPCFYQLGNWILERSMAEVSPIMKVYPDFILNINIAYSQIQHPSFREDFLDILKKTQFPRKNICLELTERCTKMNLKILKELLMFFKELGISVALDDFGTGFSSYELLRELPIDELKIDKSFISSIRSNSKDENLVRSIIECTKMLGCKSCIEGVEDEELNEYLMQFDATYHQGFYFAKPMLVENLSDYVNERR